nr:uncharacterized protein LOC129255061 [Lytechinus pictus]
MSRVSPRNDGDISPRGDETTRTLLVRPASSHGDPISSINPNDPVPDKPVYRPDTLPPIKLPDDRVFTKRSPRGIFTVSGETSSTIHDIERPSSSADIYPVPETISSRGNTGTDINPVDVPDSKGTRNWSKGKIVAIVVGITLAVVAICGVIAGVVVVVSSGEETATVSPTDPVFIEEVVVSSINVSGSMSFGDKVFTEAYNDSSSEQYQELETNFTVVMDAVFLSGEYADVYNGTYVTGFSSGSIIVNFYVVLLDIQDLIEDTQTDSGSTNEEVDSSIALIAQIETTALQIVNTVLEEATEENSTSVLVAIGITVGSATVLEVSVDIEIITVAPPASTPTAATTTSTTKLPTTTATTTLSTSTAAPTTSAVTTGSQTTTSAEAEVTTLSEKHP